MENEENAFDRVMEMAGNDGKFQKIFNYVNVLSLFICVGMIFLNNVLILNEPDHICRVPGKENFNVSYETWKNLTLPVYVVPHVIKTDFNLECLCDFLENLTTENLKV
jgi:hypothetical protein